MSRSSEIAKACRNLKFIVVDDRWERFAVKRKLRRLSQDLRRSLRWKKGQVTKLCVSLGLSVSDSDACIWEKEKKLRNIAGVWQRKMVEIKWRGKHEAKKLGLGFAVVDDVQSVADVMISAGLDVNHRVVDVCEGLSIVYIDLETESEWKVLSELVSNM
ncbi:uncharacterized protein LOC131641453 [Vicia villosa]|uniref:uncharacterized protein LOC131641453 n=1 Tax=Vicia villosa TaxID=3911 RepID=UPI00273BB031|nr:uncharacterized protein LOC131641453 [Vicia villosa]